MRFLVFLLLSSGCAIPKYYVERQDFDAAQAGAEQPVPAVRELDGAAVRLKPDTIRLIDGGTPAKVRVGGLGRKSKIWKSGLALTAIGVAMSIAGGVLVARGFSGSGDITEGGIHHSDCEACYLPGFILSGIGDGLALAIGPGLWIAGSRTKPVELP